MVVKFSKSFKGLVSYSGIAMKLTTSTNFAIYKGTRPNADEIVSNWASYNATSADILWVGNMYSFKSVCDPTTGITSVLGSPAGTNASSRQVLQTGTASWFMCMVDGLATTNVSMTNVAPWNAATITNPQHRMMFIGTVTEIDGGGFVQLPTLDLTAGNVLVPEIKGVF